MQRTRLRGAAIGATMVLGLGGLAACSDSEGPEAGAVTTSDLQGIEEQVGALEERVGAIEEGMGADTAGGGGAAAGGEDEAAVFGDTQSLVGQQVTVSAEVSELWTTTDVGSAFRIAGDGGEDPVAVIAPNTPMQLDRNDVVRVDGTVTQVNRDTFEEDFGIAADELFTDVDAFFSDAEGSYAINAREIEVLQEQADQS